MNELGIGELACDNLKEFVSGKIEEKVVDSQGAFEDIKSLTLPENLSVCWSIQTSFSS